MIRLANKGSSQATVRTDYDSYMLPPGFRGAVPGTKVLEMPPNVVMMQVTSPKAVETLRRMAEESKPKAVRKSRKKS